MPRRSGFQIAKQLIVLVKDMLPIMGGAIALGVLGFLCSIGINVLAATVVGDLWTGYDAHFTLLCTLMIVFGLLRGILRYGEQASNHFIAFKLLATLRDKVFKKLRVLAPAKLDGKDKGNLIALITSDVELLEVFYAHTISPVAIAIVTSTIISIYLMSIHFFLGLFAIIAFLAVGYVLPMQTSKIAKESGMNHRTKFGELNNFVMEFLHGLKEVIQYNLGNKKIEELENKTKEVEELQGDLKYAEGVSKGFTNTVIMFSVILMTFLALYLFNTGKIRDVDVLISVVAFASSFGPVTALSNLANNLVITFASGERILSLLEEEPQIEENTNKFEERITSIHLEDVSFSYDDENVLDGVNKEFLTHNMYGIKGKSGAGKTTMLKLLMRFYDPKEGSIRLNQKDIKDWDTTALRRHIAYFSQTTYLFQDTILNNLRLANLEASDEDIWEACKKANIHEFIETLPNKYDTMLDDLGGNFSGGQRQRLGLARVFLQDADVVLLDEPTSNLDSLNEAIILKSIKEHLQEKIVLMVSHRDSSLKIADELYTIESERLS